jgi:hypothetical protein
MGGAPKSVGSSGLAAFVIDLLRLQLSLANVRVFTKL